MPDRPGPPAPSPEPPSPPGEPRDKPPQPDPLADDALDPAADWPEEPPTDEAFEALEDWPDDEPLDEAPEDPPAPGALEPLEDWPDDDDGTLLEPLQEPVDPDPVDVFEPVILPWRTRARLPDHDLTVEAVLDPTRERTSWSGGMAGPLRIVVGGLEALVDVEVCDGPPRLRVGRDVLSGRILVES